MKTSSVIEIIPTSKDTPIASGDYVLEKYKEYERVKEYLNYPKISGRWSIVIINFPIDKIRLILGDHSQHADFKLYLKSDVVELLKSEYPQYFKQDKPNYEIFLDLIATFPIVFEKGASRELYKRTRGNVEKTREVFEYLLNNFGQEEIIQRKHVVEAILPENVTYARDVALSLLLRNNENIPRRGSFLSTYRYGTWHKRFEEYSQALPERVAFYALRKYFNELYDRKYKYLTIKGYECKDLGVIKVVDIMTLAYIKSLFLSSQPKQLYTVLLSIEGRLSNDCIILPETFGLGSQRNHFI